MMKKLLILAILIFLWVSSGLANQSGNGANGVSFLTSEVLGEKKFAIVSLPTLERGRENEKIFFPIGFQYNMNKEWFVFVRTQVYSVRKFEEDDEQKRTCGYGNTDLTIIYRFNQPLFDGCRQSFLINFHIPTANIQKNLTEGFIKYQPTYILTYNKKLKQQTRLQIFNQNGFILRQRIQKHQREPEDLDDDPNSDQTEGDLGLGLDSDLSKQSDEHTVNNHHRHGDDDPTTYGFIWNAGIALINPQTTCSLEFNWENDRWNYGDKDNLYFTPRTFININKYITVGASVPVGLTQSCDRYKLIAFIEIGVDSNNKNERDRVKPDNVKAFPLNANL
jgi:hypothetical protein